MSSKFRVRRAIPGDAEGIIGAHIASIREVCRKDYTSEQINAWSGRKFKAELWKQAIERDLVWVLEGDGVIAGFSHLAIMDQYNGEVMGLYLRPEALGFGFGKKLLDEMLQVCKDENLKFVTLHATLTAHDFYKKYGFQQHLPQTTIEMQGVPIPCVPMQLIL